MVAMSWYAVAIFGVAIVVIISNVIDSAIAGLLGVAAMVWIGIMTDVDAFGLVDWNVMAILVSVWIIASYFGRTGIPSWLSVQALRLSGGRPGLLVMILAALAGVISMFVDNVVVILMMAPVALPLARALKLPVTPLVLMIGFAANFMGSAMLLGDLPPQMLHSVSGAEFGDFFWQLGRPSSFPILMVTFVVTLVAMYAVRLPAAPAPGGRHRGAGYRDAHPQPPVRDRGRGRLPRHRARDGVPPGDRIQAGLHCHDRRRQPRARSSNCSATG